MAAKRIPELVAVTGVTSAADDQLVIFDTTENKTRRILRSELAAGVVGDLPFTPTGFVAANTIPAALDEVIDDLASSSGASLVGFTPVGGVAAANVQAAISALDNEKQPGNTGLTDIAGLAKTDGNVIVGNGTNWVAESGATARTSLGLGTGDSPQFAAIELGHATDTTITRTSAGRVAVEGNTVLQVVDIGNTVQAYDADTAKYDDTTANFTGTLQNGGSNVVVDADIGSTVQAYDAGTAKLDVAQTWTVKQTFGATAASSFELLSGGIVTESGASRTLAAGDNGKVIYCTSSSAVTITCAIGLGAGFSCTIIQGGTGKVTIAAGAATLVSYSSLFSTMGQYAVVSLISPVANTFLAAGNLGV